MKISWVFLVFKWGAMGSSLLVYLEESHATGIVGPTEGLQAQATHLAKIIGWDTLEARANIEGYCLYHNDFEDKR